MRVEKISGLSAIISLIIGVLVFFAVLLSANYHAGIWPFSTAAISALVCLIISYLVISTGLESFVHSKIKLIYRSINSFKEVEPLEDSLTLAANLDRVRYEVEAWGESHKTELADYQQREHFRREFIGNLAHEIKTPIFNIQGYVLTLLDGAMDDPKYATRYLERAQRSVERMILLINDLDEISKLESGFVEIKKKKFNLVEITKEVIDSAKPAAQERDIQFSLKGNADKQFFVNGDARRIRQVLENLVFNAVKYGNEGGLISFSFAPMHEKTLVEISDDGPGIDNRHLSRLFERFYRVDSSRSREVGGSGLGLAICKHIIEAHNERINVRSKLGEGTVFSFSLETA